MHVSATPRADALCMHTIEWRSSSTAHPPQLKRACASGTPELTSALLESLDNTNRATGVCNKLSLLVPCCPRPGRDLLQLLADKRETTGQRVAA